MANAVESSSSRAAKGIFLQVDGHVCKGSKRNLIFTFKEVASGRGKNLNARVSVLSFVQLHVARKSCMLPLGKIWPLLRINFLLFCIFELKMPVWIMKMFWDLLTVGSTYFPSSPYVQTLLKII